MFTGKFCNNTSAYGLKKQNSYSDDNGKYFLVQTT